MPSTRSSPTSSPAAMVRRTWAPSLVWCCTFQRRISPTLMCTRSRSAASIALCVPLPLPCTPMMTYLRMPPAWNTAWACGYPSVCGLSERLADILRAQREPALAPAAQLGIERGPDERPVLAQQPRVEEAGHVVAPALAQHDAVHAAAGALVGHAELPPTPPAQAPARDGHTPLRPAPGL